jgi:hypothetical protein
MLGILKCSPATRRAMVRSPRHTTASINSMYLRFISFRDRRPVPARNRGWICYDIPDTDRRGCIL